MPARTYQFSQSSIDLVALARETAIDLGYNYISSIHLLIADCKTAGPTSIKEFAFKNDADVDRFVESQRLDKEDLLHFNDESLPLTMEAETAIRNSEQERAMYHQRYIYPFHILLSSIKIPDSALLNCFVGKNWPEDLLRYYKAAGAFNIDKLTNDEIAADQYVPVESKFKSMFTPVRNIFKRKNK